MGGTRCSGIFEHRLKFIPHHVPVCRTKKENCGWDGISITVGVGREKKLHASARC